MKMRTINPLPIVAIAAVAVAPACIGMIHEEDEKTTGLEVVTPFDQIPDFASAPTVRSVRDGRWSDPAVWSGGARPRATDVVLVKHRVVFEGLGDVTTLGIANGGTVVWRTPGTLSACTIQVQPGGTLDAQPNGRSEIVIKDCPLDTTRDPEQFGTGLLVVDGTLRLEGRAKDTWVQLGAEALAGQKQLVLARPMLGWSPGDRLVLPDTRQLVPSQITKVKTGAIPLGERLTRTNSGPARLDPQWELATLSTGTTLAAPLQFSHRGARNPDGRLDLLPHVGNLTRSLVIRSANPNGTRGHVLATGRSAVTVRHVQFQDLGRTTVGGIDSTKFDDSRRVIKIGTNQVGRYALHVHHVRGPVQPDQYEYVVEGNALVDSRKWAISIHDSHFGLIRGNVVYNAAGAGITTEDGSETGNVIEKNFVVRADGSGFGVESRGRSGPELGHEGSGFWFRGANNIVRDNVAANARFAGFMYFQLLSPKRARAPRFAGTDPLSGDGVTLDVPFTAPIEFARNVAYGGNMTGFELWQGGNLDILAGADADVFGHPIFAGRDLTLWHNTGAAITAFYVPALAFDGLTVRGDVAALADPKAFPTTITGHRMVSWRFSDVDIQGLRVGPEGLIADQLLDSAFLRNEVNVSVHLRAHRLSSGKPNPVPEVLTIRNLRSAPLPGKLARHIEAGGVGALLGLEGAVTPARILVERFQNATDGFQLYFREQVPEFVIPSALGRVPGPRKEGEMQAGITNGANLSQFGLSLMGAMAPCRTIRTGIVGFACR